MPNVDNNTDAATVHDPAVELAMRIESITAESLDDLIIEYGNFAHGEGVNETAGRIGDALIDEGLRQSTLTKIRRDVDLVFTELDRAYAEIAGMKGVVAAALEWQRLGRVNASTSEDVLCNALDALP